jgi:lipopolysaccharide export LptBFGC system permease protein LptF
VTALRGGITAGQFYRFADYTILARHNREQTTARQLFLYQTNASDAGDDRLVIARRATLEGPRTDGIITLHLEDFDSFNFRPLDSSVELGGGRDCHDCPGSPAEPTSLVKIGNFDQQLELDDLLRFDPRGHDASEWTLLDVLGLGSSNLIPGRTEIAEFGHRISRSLLCIVAPLLAGLALACTTRRTQIIALPFACAMLMGLDISMGFLADEMASFGAAASLAVILLTLAATLLSMIGAGLSWQDAVVRPALGRA